MKSVKFAVLLLLSASIARAQMKIVYLSCDVSGSEGKPARHFDFNLNEANSTVSYYVSAANAANFEKAVFGPTSVVWATKDGLIQTARALDRTTLAFTDVIVIGSSVTKETGVCKVIDPPQRKF